MPIEKFKEWYENRHVYQRGRKKRTDGKVLSYICTQESEEIFYSEFGETATLNRIDIFLETLQGSLRAKFRSFQ